MKNNLMKISIIIIIFFTMIALHSNYTYALKTKITDLVEEEKENFNPLIQQGDSEKVTSIIVNLVTKILPVIKFIGGVIMVISLALFGLYRVLASEGDLPRDLGIGNIITSKNSKVLMDAGRSIVIGSILLFSSSVIVEFILKLFV